MKIRKLQTKKFITLTPGGRVVATCGESDEVTEAQSMSAGSMPGATVSLGMPRSSSLMAPMSGYLTPLPHTVPLKSSMSTVQTIAPAYPWVLIQSILFLMDFSSSKPTHWSPWSNVIEPFTSLIYEKARVFVPVKTF
jgi:hypothetical protein